MLDWGIIGAIAGIISVLVAIYFNIIPKCIDFYRRRKFNKKICELIVEQRNEYLEEIYDLNTVEDIKPFKLEKSQHGEQNRTEKEDFIAFSLPSSIYADIKNLDLDGIALIIDWGVTREIRERLTQKGLEYEDADEIAKEDTKDFIELKLSKVIPKHKSIQTIKTKISKEESISIRRNFIRRNSQKIRSIVRKNYNQNLKESYNKYVYADKDYIKLTKNDVSEIIKSVQSKKTLKEELDVRKPKQGGFSKTTTDKLLELKKSFLSKKKSFVKRVAQINNRSEEIYAIILAYPGLYELEMSNLFDIPQPTISIYSEEMSKKGFLIKDTYSTPGNYVYLFPLFSQKEIKDDGPSLTNYDIGIISKILKKNESIVLEDFEDYKLNLEQISINIARYIGDKVFVKVRIHKNEIIILSLGIVKSRNKQESLTKYFE